VWDEVSEILWDRLNIPACEGCKGTGGSPDDGECGICQGTGHGTMWHPSLDDDPVAQAAREIDTRIHGVRTRGIFPGAREALRDIL
jgi:hypothetical protein